MSDTFWLNFFGFLTVVFTTVAAAMVNWVKSREAVRTGSRAIDIGSENKKLIQQNTEITQATAASTRNLDKMAVETASQVATAAGIHVLQASQDVKDEINAKATLIMEQLNGVLDGRIRDAARDALKDVSKALTLHTAQDEANFKNVHELLEEIRNEVKRKE